MMDIYSVLEWGSFAVLIGANTYLAMNAKSWMMVGVIILAEICMAITTTAPFMARLADRATSF